MAKCDGGYFCYSCGEYVENITVSELYLRYVMREVPYEKLLETVDGHIRCNANLAQYIVDDRFEPVEVDEPKLAKANLDPAFVRAQEERVTRAWRHLQALPQSGIPMREYPLDEDGVWRGASSEPEADTASSAEEPTAFEC